MGTNRNDSDVTHISREDSARAVMDAGRAKYLERLTAATRRTITFAPCESFEAQLLSAGRGKTILPDGYLVNAPEPESTLNGFEKLFNAPDVQQEAEIYRQNSALCKGLRDMVRKAKVDSQYAVYHTTDGVWISKETVNELVKSNNAAEAAGKGRHQSRNAMTVKELGAELLAAIEPKGHSAA